MEIRDRITELIEEKKALFTDVSDRIWENPELGFLEFKSSEILINALKQEGFTVEKNIAGVPNSFKAVWGNGKPIIGFLGEYDALPSMSQKAMSSEKCPIFEGAPGHGCGHNALGAGSLAAAVTLKEYLHETRQSGTVIYMGCPAEESGCGKAFMAREGVFNCLDAAITWHPNFCNGIWSSTTLADYCVLFKFKGITSHAAASPHLGRSALDAAELMNVGVNFLREHIIDQARIHYAFLDVGGSAPNVVQDSATLYYYMRAPKNKQIMDIYPRVVKIAQGAALMTETDITIEVKSALSDYIPNKTLSKLMGECNIEMGGIEFSEESKEFAEKIYDTISEGDKDAVPFLLSTFCTEDEIKKLAGIKLIGNAFEYHSSSFCIPGSTDVGDVSYVVPTVQMVATTSVKGTPGHSWQQTTQAGSTIAHEGLLYAGKVMAYTAVKLIQNPDILSQAWNEHKLSVPEGYHCPIPPDVFPEAQ